MRTPGHLSGFSLVASTLILVTACADNQPPADNQSQQSESATLSGSPWSDPATWPSGEVPGANAEVVIGPDMEVLLDIDPPALRSLTIDGKLTFADDLDIELVTEWVFLRGELEVGTEDRPHISDATITLTNNVPDENVNSMGDRGIMIMGGKLSLHGNRENSWTKLAATAEAGSNEIAVLDASGWQVGDAIVLASTDFDPYQAEKRLIAAIDGNRITLDEALEFMHYGEITFGVDQRGEVGMLSRNVRVQASEDSEEDYFGGHIMAMPASEMRISGIELTRMGQHMHLARYPVHWHTIGDTENQYIENSAIHHTYSRCVTVHGTNNLRVENNVAYDNVGHCYFMEDGIENDNRIVRNLGIMTRCHPTKPCNPTNAFNGSNEGQQADDVLLPSDNTVSTFWITNPDNIIRDNVAAGSEQIGFWIALPEHPTGAYEGTDIAAVTWPRRTQLREFSGNVAHSNFDSLMFDRGPSPAGTFGLGGNTHLAYSDPNDTSSEKLITVIDDFTSYKNRNAAIWARGENHLFSNMKLADNGIGYTHAYTIQAEYADFTSRVVDSLFVGETDNIGNPRTESEIAYGRSLPNPENPDYPIRGYEYYDFFHEVENVRFVNYEDNDTRQAGALSYLLYSNFPISTQNYVANVTFENAKPAHFPQIEPRWAFELGSEFGYKGGVFLDKDGSIGDPGDYIVIDNGIATDAEACDIRESWGAGICKGDFGLLELRGSDGESGFGIGFANPATGGAAITLSRNDREFVAADGGGFFRPGFEITTVRAGTQIKAETESEALSLGLRELEHGSWVLFELPGFATANTGTELNSLEAVRDASETSYYNDDDTLWVKLFADSSFGEGGDGEFPGIGGGTIVEVRR